MNQRELLLVYRPVALDRPQRRTQLGSENFVGQPGGRRSQVQITFHQTRAIRARGLARNAKLTEDR
jgi:hypothetical protein